MRYSHSRINFGTGGQRLKARVSIEKRAERFNVMLEIARHGNGWHFVRLYDGRCWGGPFLVICLCTFRAILLVLRCYARKRPFCCFFFDATYAISKAFVLFFRLLFAIVARRWT